MEYKYKIWVGNNPDLNREIQELLFELGYYWDHLKKKDNDGKRFTHDSALCLRISKNDTISCIKPHSGLRMPDTYKETNATVLTLSDLRRMTNKDINYEVYY